MIILPAQLSELTGSSKANSTGSSLANSSPGSTQTRQTSNKDTINHVQTQSTRCRDDMLCGMRCGMQNARYDRKCMNLASTWKNQVCHWKDEMKLLENDIKNAGICVTVWKWQAIQKWHRSAIYSKLASKCKEMNMLQHSNMTTTYMAGMHTRCLTKV